MKKKAKKKRAPGRPSAKRAMSGRALKKARVEAEWSLRSTAAELKISGASLHALESGDAAISAERAAQIVELFQRQQKTPPPLLKS